MAKNKNQNRQRDQRPGQRSDQQRSGQGTDSQESRRPTEEEHGMPASTQPRKNNQRFGHN